MQNIKIDFNKLNCMNYHIELIEYGSLTGDYWYAKNGIRSLWCNAKHYNLDFKDVLIQLNKTGQYLDSKIVITMI